MWVPERNVLFVSGRLESGNKPVLVKIKATGGGGQNMFALTPSGGSFPGYNYRLGSQFMTAQRMSYNGNLEVGDGVSTTYRIKDVSGTGDNMFALVNDAGCGSVPGYSYFIECIVK